jgi:hypothetical protein
MSWNTLTTNSPAFGEGYEKALWLTDPTKDGL